MSQKITLDAETYISRLEAKIGALVGETTKLTILLEIAEQEKQELVSELTSPKPASDEETPVEGTVLQ